MSNLLGVFLSVHLKLYMLRILTNSGKQFLVLIEEYNGLQVLYFLKKVYMTGHELQGFYV